MRLVREETTHFYSDGAGAEQAARPGEPAASAPAGQPLRTADRRALGVPPAGPQPPSITQPHPPVPPRPDAPPRPAAPSPPGIAPVKPL